MNRVRSAFIAASISTGLLLGGIGAHNIADAKSPYARYVPQQGITAKKCKQVPSKTQKKRNAKCKKVRGGFNLELGTFPYRK